MYTSVYQGKTKLSQRWATDRSGENGSPGSSGSSNAGDDDGTDGGENSTSDCFASMQAPLSLSIKQEALKQVSKSAKRMARWR